MSPQQVRELQAEQDVVSSQHGSFGATTGLFFTRVSPPLPSPLSSFRYTDFAVTKRHKCLKERRCCECLNVGVDIRV